MVAKKKMYYVLGALALSIVLTQPARADDNRDDNNNNQALSGSYVVSITLDLPGPPPPAPGLVTYFKEGSVVANEIVNFTRTPLQGLTFTEDHGTWARIGNGKFLVTFIKLASSNGVLAASVKTRAEVQSQGDSFTGKFRVDVVSPAGGLLFFVTGHINGQRMKAETLP